MQPRRIDRPKNVKEFMGMMSTTDLEETQVMPSMWDEENTQVLDAKTEKEDNPKNENEKKRSIFWIVIPLAVLLLVGVMIYNTQKTSIFGQNESPEVINGTDGTNNSIGPENESNSFTSEEVSTNSGDVSEIGNGNDDSMGLTQTSPLNLKGSFYNQKGSWPVEFVIRIKKDGQISGVYKNISQHVSMKVGGQLYSDGSMELYDLNGNLHVSLSKTDLGKYNGKASSGQTTLNVTLTEQ